MKKLTAIVLCLVLFVTLTACNKTDIIGTPLTINQTAIDSEIFSYFLYNAFSEHRSKDDRISAATQECIRYIAVNTAFEQRGLSLSADEKAKATEAADFLWNTFSEAYKRAGVSKATFVKIYISSQYTEKLREAVFGKGGTDEISEAQLRGALVEYFISYRTITVPMYKTDEYGNRLDLTDDEKDVLRHVFSDGAQKINNGENIESVASEISVTYPDAKCDYETIVKSINSHDITEEFFNQVLNMKENYATPVEAGDMLYIVLHTSILSDTSIFEDYREECLKLLSDGPLTSLVNELCNGFSAVRNTETVSKIYKRTEEAKLYGKNN